MMKVVLWLLAIVAVLLLFLFCAAVYQQSKSPTITIFKNEWNCTKKRTDIILLPMQVGDSLVQVPHTQEVCIEYQKTN